MEVCDIELLELLLIEKVFPLAILQAEDDKTLELPFLLLKLL